MAPPFDFRLAPLLDRRRSVEEEKQRRCALRLRECGDAALERDRLVSALAERATHSTDAGSLAVLDIAIAVQRRRAAEAQFALEAARDELTAASRERAAIEKLRERRLREFEEEEARRDELEIEEANARRPRR
jgi:flagellar export protein FliJ